MSNLCNFCKENLCKYEENRSEKVIKLHKRERVEANNSELREYISDMAFDLALMARQVGMSGVAQMLSIAALEVGLNRNN